MNPIDKAQSIIPLMKDWPPPEERKTVDVYALSGIPNPKEPPKENLPH